MGAKLCSFSARGYGADIHLLLTDVVMPHLSGRQLAERLRALHPQMKIIYMSGYADDSFLRQGALDSAFVFLQKPKTPDKLTRKVREALDAP